jgi:hypothetical protein
MPFLSFRVFFLQWNISDDGIIDCNGFLPLWRCFCFDLIRLFWLSSLSLLLLRFIVVMVHSFFIASFCIRPWDFLLLFANQIIAASYSLLLLFRFLFRVASFREFRIDSKFKILILTAAFFFLLFVAPVFCSFFIILYCYGFCSRLRSRNYARCFFLYEAQFRLLFVPQTNRNDSCSQRSMPLPLPRTVIRSAVLWHEARILFLIHLLDCHFIDPFLSVLCGW